MLKNQNRNFFLAFLLAWLCGTFITYFLLGFLSAFYVKRLQIFGLGIFFETTGGLAFYFLIRSSLAEWSLDWRRSWLDLLIWLACLAFASSVIYLSLQFPNLHLFDASVFLLDPSRLRMSIAIFLLSLACGFFLLRFLSQRGYDESIGTSRIYRLLKANFPGLCLAAVFLIIYFSLAATFGILPDDNFYDTDPTSWLNRLAAPADQLIEMRPVHPFAFLIFRPLVWLVSLFLAGNKFYAALLLNAGAGALCVLLAWYLVHRWSQNKTFALLVAAVLGMTTSHLILSASLETYIFSAAALISFLILAQREPRSLKALVPAGLLTFGITLTNFIQTCILFLFVDFKIARIAKYVAVVILAALVLAFFQVQLYPTSQPFYFPSNLRAEDRFSYNILHESFEHTVERAHALARTIALFSIVAPRPLVLLEEVGCQFPCFKTYKPSYGADLMNSYVGFGSFLARAWFLVLLIAGGLFIRQLFKFRKILTLQAALLVCILFNFVLHMNYGDDPMLYSGDWTYAVIFFVALSFKDLADKQWFQAGGLAFMMMLMINNWRFLDAVLKALSPYFS